MTLFNRIFWGRLLVITTILTGCTTSTPASSISDHKLAVVATFSILGDWLHTVGGDSIALTTLVGEGSDTHTFEPSPTDSVALSHAQLIVEIGVGYESWLDPLYQASNSKAERVIVSQGIQVRNLESEVDPHLWHDVQNAIKMVETIRDALSTADSENAQSYNANADAYLQQLRELDQWIQVEVAKIPPEQRKLVTNHDTFGYFAARYGFELVGSALASASTETADPAAANLVALVERIKAERVPAIFAENVSNPELLERIAQEAGVTLAPPLYTDALGEPGSDSDTYIKMMRYNVTTIVTALSQQQ